MVIYGAFLIPFIVAFVLYKYFKRDTSWWEYFVPLIVSVILIISSKAIIETSQVSSKEYWGSFISKAEYFEEWDEWIDQTCTRECCCDSKGENCSTETYDCSYRLYHPAYWQITTTIGERINISESEYARVKKILGNESFQDLDRDYYRIDGDEYYSIWRRDSATAIPVTTLHYYENRVKAADQSVFHYGKVTKQDIEKYKLKEYPKIYNYYQMASVIGDSSVDALIADKKINYVNGLLGHKKEVRVFVLVFKNQPIEAALYQEWYWSGANMNEFVVCIGIDNDRNVKWCKPMSWTRSEILKVKVKSFVQEQGKLNLQELAYFMQNSVDREFLRRDFAEFNYLTVEPPTWTVFLTYFLTLLVNIGLSWWIIHNEHEEE